jgi:3-phenylpropionate/trans-cinnamate dioxygenase ferredoxin reductase subunit
MRTIAVVGASLAGLSAARALRAQGYDGRLVVVGDEQHTPYDRPPLSKDFLRGEVTSGDIALGTAADDALDLNWRLGRTAVRLDRADRSLALSTGEEFRVDGVVVATGARARTLPGSSDVTGVYTLRTLDDAVTLREALRHSGSLVVIGAGFIGAEVASAARSLGLQVTVVDALAAPLAGSLGTELGQVCADLHADYGVRLIAGVGVTALVGAGRGGRGRILGVRLADGRQLPADTVVVGVGALPNVEWLTGSGLRIVGGVVTDETCATGVPGVVAVGDCATAYDPRAGRHLRTEHWTHASEAPATAAATLLAGERGGVAHSAVPYFWSDQYGVRIQFAGHRRAGATVRVVEGDVAERQFVAVYERDRQVVAVLGMNSPTLFTRLRRQLDDPPPGGVAA